MGPVGSGIRGSEHDDMISAPRRAVTERNKPTRFIWALPGLGLEIGRSP
jgi:hypothetical protein